MKLFKILIFELLLIFASVLIFRSLWTIFDGITIMNHDAAHVISLVIGIVITIISLIKLNQMLDDKKK
jgi:hypothetical protein